MEPPSKDYLSVSDLSRPRQTPLQEQISKIDPSVIKYGVPSSRSHQRGHARQRTDTDLSVFESSILAFREIILNRLWKCDQQFQNERDFCKQQWDILQQRKVLLIECAELLMELVTIPTRPRTEHVCKALIQASIARQPSSLQRTSVAPELWRRVLKAWRAQHGINPNEPVDVENMSAEFVNAVLQSSTSVTQNPQPTPSIQGLTNPSLRPLHEERVTSSQVSTPIHSNPHVQQHPPSQDLTFANHQHVHQPQHATGHKAHPHIEVGTSASQPIPSPTSPGAASTSQSEPFRSRIPHLLTDERRFHAPSAVLERVHQFFKGPPQLDAAAFEGSTLNALISVPFPDIMDTDGWRVPATFNSGSLVNTEFAPVQSCFLHVPILPSKRRFETDTEVILLDDVRLAGQLNAKLWEEFSSGNVLEAISLVPTSATWFGKTELADWPCVIMSGLKFEQANGSDPSGKKLSEVHSYIVVFLGRDPIRQAQFVHTFQDLGISPPQHPDGGLGTASTQTTSSQRLDGHHHRWIAGFRRLFRTQGVSSSGNGSWSPSQVSKDDDDSNDPRFDDIYSILPPSKKPRLERAGRPSDVQAVWHHSKRRKTDKREFSKLKDHNQDNQHLGSDDEMSE
ncbi:hypothetical protein B0O80DRAFT_463992 [Mortierella sp. GBAus27b]|nr:hypothetical protein B0O80DRAFT_463992 [Mortierella sp. GBAus27b]